MRKDRLSGNADEGENIFGTGSMTSIAITILVRSSRNIHKSEIYFRDIGKNLNRDQKLRTVQQLRSIGKISEETRWHKITPNESYEWINQGDRTFSRFLQLKDKNSLGQPELFSNYSLGFSTNRDSWLINASRSVASTNTSRFINFYNEQLSKEIPFQEILSVPHRIKWSSGLINRYKKNNLLTKKDHSIITILYRPFTKSNLVKNKEVIERFYSNELLFPDVGTGNLVIGVCGPGSRSEFSVIMSDQLVNLSTLEGVQCFPLTIYSRDQRKKSSLLKSDKVSVINKLDGITEYGLRYFSEKYPSGSISKEDLFYYVYGLLHSEDYRSRFRNNLRKELPKIPAVKQFDDFVAFSEAGRKLGQLHVNYESLDVYPVHIKEGNLKLTSPSVDLKKFYRVTKMKFGGTRPQQDKSTVIYNEFITMQNIPIEAYEYVINGKPALKWVMDQQCVKTDKKSGITNDANDYANEVMMDPAYPLKLFQRVITVSLETMKIIRGLPNLVID